MHFTEYDTRVAAYVAMLDENRERVLLTWFNGRDGSEPPCWTLPGGGVEFDEGIEQAVVREVREETGYEIALGPVLTTHSFTGPSSVLSARPFKSVRLVYDAQITGGDLGTQEVDGTTDFAEWVPLDRLLQAGQRRSSIVDVAFDVLRLRG